MSYAYAAPRDPTDVVGRRIAAYVLDGILVFIALVVILAMVKDQHRTGAPSGACSILRSIAESTPGQSSNVVCVQIGSQAWVWERGDFLAAVDIAVLIGILNLVVLQAVTGASVGKHATGLRVVDEQGAIAGFIRTIVRWLFLIVDGFLAIVGLITVLATHPHRRVGDFAAGTFVIGKMDVGRTMVAARPDVAYGGAVFAPPMPGATAPVAVAPAPVPLAPGWGVGQPLAAPQVPLTPAESPWSTPPTAPSPQPVAPPVPAAATPAPIPVAPPPVAPPPVAPPLVVPPAVAPAAPQPAPPAYAPPPAAAPAPTPPAPVAPLTPTPPAPGPPRAPAPAPQPAPAPAPQRAPAPQPAPAPRPAPAFAPSQPRAAPDTRRAPEPESWWDTAIPTDSPDGDERP